MIKTTLPTPKSATPSRRGGFTLVEILVAVSIMAVLLVVILVPLRMGFESFSVGKSRSDVQQQAQATLNLIANDIRKSGFVFPNSFVDGVSNNSKASSNCSSAPYRAGTSTTEYSWKYRPYVITDTNDDASKKSPYDIPSSNALYGVCSPLSTGTTGMRAWNNLSRLDMIQKRRNDQGSTLDSNTGQDFIVTYYPRRLDITKPFDVVDNPIVLFRAQIPFRTRDKDGNPEPLYVPSNTGGRPNAQIDWTRYPPEVGACGTGPNAANNRDFLWITHNFYGEADLQPLTDDAVSPTNIAVVPGAHTQVTPRDMSIVAPLAGSDKKESLVPELSFREESSNGQRIDRVTITMTLAQYDSTGTASTNGQASAQRVRVSQTVDLPNVSCGP
jgi:prepilin-type N-terminal cleavage/methylation domain-containing protein